MRVLARLLRVSPWHLFASVVTGCVSGACAGVLVTMIQRLAFGAEIVTAHVIGLFAILTFAQVTLRIVSLSEGLRTLQIKLLPNLRSELARSIVSAPLRTLEDVGTARLAGALTADGLSIGLASMGFVFAAHNVVAIVTCLAAVGRASVVALALVVGSIGVGVFVFYVLSVVARRHAARAQDARVAMYGEFDTLVTGIKELTLSRSRRRAFLDRGVAKSVDGFHSLNARAASANEVAAAWAAAFMFVVIGLLLFVWPRMVVVSSQLVAAYVVAILYVQAELHLLFHHVPRIVAGELVLRSVEKLGLHLTNVRERSDGGRAEINPPQTAPWSSLEIDHVTHTYRREGQDEEFTLGPVSLRLEPGEIVFIVGGNGSGKSTLAKLLTGLYVPEGGEIRIDQQPLTERTLEAYRERFSAVFADFWLFDRVYGVGDVGDAATRHIARLRLAHKVTVKDGVFSTTNLSQGQKKRLALVTAYVEDRPICVFDEWAADQDPAFKEVFYRELLPELKARGKTAVVITHDDRYFACADRVLRMHDGKLEPMTPPSGA